MGQEPESVPDRSSPPTRTWSVGAGLNGPCRFSWHTNQSLKDLYALAKPQRYDRDHGYFGRFLSVRMPATGLSGCNDWGGMRSLRERRRPAALAGEYELTQRLSLSRLQITFLEGIGQWAGSAA